MSSKSPPGHNGHTKRGKHPGGYGDVNLEMAGWLQTKTKHRGGCSKNVDVEDVCVEDGCVFFWRWIKSHGHEI